MRGENPTSHIFKIERRTGLTLYVSHIISYSNSNSFRDLIYIARIAINLSLDNYEISLSVSIYFSGRVNVGNFFDD